MFKDFHSSLLRLSFCSFIIQKKTAVSYYSTLYMYAPFGRLNGKLKLIK